jgi:hypothetical protein
MFEIKDTEKYSIKNNPLAEKTDQLIKGVRQKQEEILQEILSAHNLTKRDIILHGSKQIMGGITTIFYKDKPIAVFTKEEIKTEGNVTTLSQKYEILK